MSNNRVPTSRSFLPLGCLLLLVGVAAARAEEPAAAPAMAASAASRPAPRALIEASPKDLEDQLRESMKNGGTSKKKLNLIIDNRSGGAAMGAGSPPPQNPVDGEKGGMRPPAGAASRAPEPGLILRPRVAPVVAAHHEVHWSYGGEGGPEHWAQLRTEYASCGNGHRQSPIAIEDAETLQGPAEPIDFHYRASQGTVSNNGHSIEVRVYGDNQITVRGTTYQLVQFHFHHPAEERINGQGYPMVAHLVHRSDSGQLAVVAVLLDVGEANPLLDKVWTYTPLDVNDSVRMPPDLIHVAELLPGDQRYYQFFGSLTTPPCTEGVLWLIMKQPVSISRDQLRLFAQLYPNNARPIQPGFERPVRNAVVLSGSAPPTAAPSVSRP